MSRRVPFSPWQTKLIRKALRQAKEVGRAEVRAELAALSELNGSTEAFLKGWDENKHKRDHGKFSSTGGGESESGKHEEDKADNPRSLLDRVKDVPHALREKVTSFVRSKYDGLVSKYGATGAKAVLAATVLLLPVPVPGTSLLPVAIAEAIRRIVGAAKGKSGPEMKAMPTELSEEEIQAAAHELLDALHEEFGDEAETDVPDGTDGDVIALAMVEHVLHSQAVGDDPEPGLEELRGFIEDGKDDNEPAPIGYCPECGSPGVMRERRPNGNDRCKNDHIYPSRDAVKPGMQYKAFDESKHPRGKNGRFIGKDRIEAAKSDPKLAAELRKEVKPEDAGKLDAALSGEFDPGRTKRGQERHEAGQRRQAKEATRKRADELIAKLSDFHAKPGSVKLTAEDLHALADHLPALPVERLRAARMALRANLKGDRRKEDIVRRLVDHANGMASELTPKKNKIATAKTPETLYQAVREYGGIDPDSHAFQTVYGSVGEARENGISLGVFKKGGEGLDVIAQQMQNAGHFSVPENRDPGEYLLEQLAKGAYSNHANLEKQYEGELDDYYRRLQEEADATERPKIEEALRDGKTAGRAEEVDREGEEVRGSDDAEGVDTSFDFGANAPADTAPEPTSQPVAASPKDWWNSLTSDEQSAALASVDAGSLSPRKQRLLSQLPGKSYDHDWQGSRVIDQAHAAAQAKQSDDVTPADIPADLLEREEPTPARGSDLVAPEDRIMTPGQATRAESRGRQIAEQNASRIAADKAFEARRARAEQMMPGIGAMPEKQVKELGAKLGVKQQPGEKFGDYRAKVAAAHDMEQQAKPAGAAVDIHDPAQLADAVHAAAAKLPDWRGHGAESGQFGGHKVYVSELYDAMKPQLGGVSLDDFKAALGKANAAGAVQAEPIDMPMYAKNPEQHVRSAISSGTNVVGHAVRVAAGAKGKGAEDAEHPREHDYHASQLESGAWVTPYTLGTYSSKRDAMTEARKALNDYAPRKPAKPKPPNPHEAELRQEINASANEQQATGKIAKQNSERTQAEFIKREGAMWGGPEKAAAAHRRIIEGSLARGESVPSEVLADYPDLAPKAAPAQPITPHSTAANVVDRLSKLNSDRSLDIPKLREGIAALKLDSLSHGELKEVATGLGYPSLAKMPKGQLIQKLTGFLEGIKQSQMRSDRITPPAPVQPLTPHGIAAAQSAERANAPANLGLADAVQKLKIRRVVLPPDA